MTSTGPQEHERDWDAEFAEITGRLGGLSSDEAGTSSPTNANRVHFDSPDALVVDRPDALVVDRPDVDAEPVRGAAPWLGADRASVPDEAPRAVPPRELDLGPAVGTHVPFAAIPSAAMPALNDAAAASDTTDEPGFVPAPPRPLEADDPATVIMIGALIAGPLWLIYLTALDREAGGFWWLLAGLTVVVGLGLAIARQPQSRDEDDDDDGARV